MRKRTKKNEQTGPRETVEEFLARGGTVTKCPPAPSPEEDLSNRVSSTVGASSTMMSLAEGALFYSESRAKSKERKKKVEPVINFAALPASLLKYMPKKEES
jgi:hypothetical protein